MVWKFIAATYFVMSVVTFFAYRSDKRRAVAGGRRIAERRLHLLELAGGWPGAIVAQQVFRHKRRKFRYLAAMGMIVLLHAALWAVWFIHR